VLVGPAVNFVVTLSSPSWPEFTVSCPDATAVGLDPEIAIDCGSGDVRLVADDFVTTFAEELWTAGYGGGPPSVEAESTCEYGPSCDCNCIPTDCELDVPPGFDDG
jgi:hypothetical protein